jgi:hypothetical protein
VKRLRKSLGVAVIGVSLVLCITISLIWIASFARSAWFSIDITQDNGHRVRALWTRVDFRSDGTGLYIAPISSSDPEEVVRYSNPEKPIKIRGAIGQKAELFSPYIRKTHHGFALYYEGTNTPSTRHFILDIRVPYWFLCLTFAVLPAMTVIKRYRRRDVCTTACAKCGYDLRARPERCPECGAIPAGEN